MFRSPYRSKVYLLIAVVSRSDVQFIILVVTKKDGEYEKANDAGNERCAQAPPEMMPAAVYHYQALCVLESCEQNELPNGDRDQRDQSDNPYQHVRAASSKISHRFSPSAACGYSA